MKTTFKDSLIVSLLSALVLTGMFIYVFETRIIPDISNNLVSTIFTTNDRNYEYTISIPDYWDVYTKNSETGEMIYTGNNSEYLTINVSKKEDTYDASLYSTYRALEIYGKYNVELENFEEKKINGKFVFSTSFNVLDNNHVVGFVENEDFLIDFEYKRPSTNNINASLYNIVTSIEQFEVEEVNLDGEVVEK